jgi:hypothetical protein
MRLGTERHSPRASPVVSGVDVRELAVSTQHRVRAIHATAMRLTFIALRLCGIAIEHDRGISKH